MMLWAVFIGIDTYPIKAPYCWRLGFEIKCVWFRCFYRVRRAGKRAAFPGRTIEPPHSQALCGVSLARFSGGASPFPSPP